MLSNGSIEESVVDYSCNPNYYLVNENANVRFSCELGAMWEPKILISCIRGLTNLVNINTFINQMTRKKKLSTFFFVTI